MTTLTAALAAALPLLAAPARAQFGNISSQMSSAAETMKSAALSAETRAVVDAAKKLAADVSAKAPNEDLAAAYLGAGLKIAKDAGCAKLPELPADCASADFPQLRDAAAELNKLDAIALGHSFGAQTPGQWYSAQAAALEKDAEAPAALDPELAELKKLAAAKLDPWAIPELDAALKAARTKAVAEKARGSAVQSLIDAEKRLAQLVAAAKPEQTVHAAFHAEAARVAKEAGCARVPVTAADCAKAEPAALKEAAAAIMDLDNGPISHWVFGALTPADYYRRELARDDARIKALGECSFVLAPKLAELNAQLAAKLDVHKINALMMAWSDVFKGMNSAESRCAAMAREKQPYQAQIDAANAAIAAGRAMPPAVADGLRATVKTAAAHLDCKGRCDDDWERQLRDAKPDFDALSGEISRVSGTWTSLRSQSDRLKMNVRTTDQPVLGPFVTKLYDALGAGPLEKAQAAYDALKDALSKLRESQAAR